MGDSKGPEVDGLRAALDKAKECAKVHLVEVGKERATVESSIVDAERRFGTLSAGRSHQPAGRIPPMPKTLVRGELSTWLDDQHADFLEALIDGHVEQA